jgi:RHS repeat-associated protein
MPTASVREKFTQKERDNETGLDFFLSRYYSSTQGRFTGADALGGRVNNPQTLNRYVYVSNNPLRYIDPSGNQQSDQEQEKNKPQNPDGKPEKPDLPVTILQADLDVFSSVKITYIGIAPEESPVSEFFSRGQGELAGSMRELRATLAAGSAKVTGWLRSVARHIPRPRLPDFYQLEFDIPIDAEAPPPVDLVGVAVQITVDRHGNIYFGSGGYIGLPGSNITAGYLTENNSPLPSVNVPSQDETKDFIENLSVGASGGTVTIGATGSKVISGYRGAYQLGGGSPGAAVSAVSNKSVGRIEFLGRILNH